LVIEHLAPRGLLIADLIESAAVIDGPSLVHKLEEGLAATVVAKAEDQVLAAAKVAGSYPAGADHLADPWCRYRIAGLDIDQFQPLAG
jgi:hypothetical protein